MKKMEKEIKEMFRYEYLQLMKENPRIDLAGFKIGRRGSPKQICDSVEEILTQVMKEQWEIFEVVRSCMEKEPSLSRGLYVSSIRRDFERRMWRYGEERPFIPLGVTMLALISLGFKIRQVRGKIDGRIVGREKP